MITEDYVSFEIAKLLKEKGFDCVCKVWYSEYTSQFGGEKYTSIEFDDHNRFEKDCKFLFYAPTLQMAMKWLREVHNMYYEIRLLLGEKAVKYGELQLGIYQLSSSEAYVWKDWIYADTYVELYENYIKYCLENLI